MAEWILKNTQVNLELMSKTLGTSKIISKIISNRNMVTKKTAIRFLNSDTKYFCNNKDFLNINNAIKTLLEYKDKKIVIYGDYDVDGVMSTTILYKGLYSIFKNLVYYIPHREKDGYGLNIKLIKKFKNKNIDLILCCDNGISAIEEVELANELGMEVIILDHHEPVIKDNMEILPNAIIVNPKQSNCTYPFKELCAAGICYKFILELYIHLNIEIEKTFHDELLIFAAIGTLCDVVNLKDENRIIVKKGLNLLQNPIKNFGLMTLVKEKELLNINEESIGFVIGPCINAAGRLDTAMLAASIFISEDKEYIEKATKKVVELNEERKKLTKNAIDNIANEIYKDDNVIVIYKQDIHESIAGIVAGRIKDKIYKPTIIITKGEKFAKGSGRSVEGYNLYENLSKYRHLFYRFGGHEMAAGLSMDESKIEELKISLNNDFKNLDIELKQILEIDANINLDMATYNFVKEIDVLRPFGKGNNAPLFLTKNVRTESLNLKSEKNTLIFDFLTESERRIKGICFNKIEKFVDLINNNYNSYEANKILGGILRTANLKLDIVYSIEFNNYRGLTSVQLNIVDFDIGRFRD
ncbi:MAG: single-stranded-DNA-specific exonuclease RecJ [Defluviitaleaceae bacterium]|nr:single-stranded-DNA-specific exonuclease RecJ [Defluviitaleaceae bacterium]